MTTTKKISTISLNFEVGPLQWSSGAPGKTGYYYFTDRLPETPDWEFAYTEAKDITEFDGKPLKAKFCQRFSPSRDERLGRTRFGNSIWISKGQVILARTSDDPDTIYILQIHQQAQEAIAVRYVKVRE